jgi:dihydropteroate synthase
MHYVCIEENKIVSILNYSPAVPASVSVYEITDQQAAQIKDQTHYFDITSKSLQPVASSITAEKEQHRLNGIEREFLNSTDWKILRHIRQQALNVPTTLTESEFLELEQQRQAAAARIV